MANYQNLLISEFAHSHTRNQNALLYARYEWQKHWLMGASKIAAMQVDILKHPLNPLSHMGFGSVLSSALDVFAHASFSYGKPEFGIKTVDIDGKSVAVTEEVLASKTFGQLRHFIREGGETSPKLLIVAPMSGHFATLLRGTVARMIPFCDVYITDWADARDVPLERGSFDLDDYTEYLMDWLRDLGPHTHVLAVCQPSVPVYVATCLMAEDGDECRPASITLMGGPVDTRESRTVVNTIAEERPLSWYKDNVIATVPAYYRGAGRLVYPGFMQLSGFMAMNLGNHMMSHWDMFKDLVGGDEEGAEATKDFYEEYRAVCDMTSEFYLQTVEQVFQKHLLPKGEWLYRGRKVDAGCIKDVAILAIEGERDDISGLGQTKAALTLAHNLPDDKKQYHMAEKVGHYGIFNGSRWRDNIAPVVENWIMKNL